LDHNFVFDLDIFGLMYEELEKIKGFFKDEQSFFEAKQLLFKNEDKFGKDLLFQIVELIRDAVFVFDSQWRYLHVNVKGQELALHDKEELLGKEMWKVFPELLTTELGEGMLTSVRESKIIHINQYKYTNGRWFDFLILPLKENIIVIVNEITLHKKAEIGYENVVTKNRAILSAIPDFLYRIHDTGKLINYKEYPEFFDWENIDSDIKLLSVDEIFPKSHIQLIKKMTSEVLINDTLATMEYSADEYDGEKYYEIRISKSGEKEVLAIVRNITIRKKAERLKNEFISLVSHELRTPLTSVKGAIELLIGGVAGDLSNQAKSLLNICRKNTLRLVRFVSDLLDIEALDSGNVNFVYKPHSLEEIVLSAIEGTRTFAEQYHVQLEYEKNCKQILVYVDEDRLSHCITNLISNAVKYTPKHSSVTISIGEKDKNAFIKVKDLGPGIDPDLRPRLFHRFVQGPPPKDKLVGGSGLGLSITKAFTEQMLGSVYYESSPSGSTFFIELPIWTENKTPLGAE